MGIALSHILSSLTDVNVSTLCFQMKLTEINVVYETFNYYEVLCEYLITDI